MSDDKIGNKTGSEGLSETDKGYYEDLYNDLPKEVVDILMQTHPLMGKNATLRQPPTAHAVLRDARTWRRSRRRGCSRSATRLTR